MASVWDKIDSGLALIYSNYLSVKEHGPEAVLPVPEVADGGPLLVELRYAGDLAPVKAAGFRVVKDDGKGRATGGLRLADLEAVAARAEVLGIRYGSEPQLNLDKSIPQVRADQLWTVGPAPNFVFSGDTGAGALVGVIDTGADIHHPFLWLQSKPVKKTRIRRIWDLGLDAGVGESAPDVALLEGGAGGTYGVEYKDTDIDKILQGLPGTAIRSRDCSGHGTHVASTAAGDGRFKFKFIGVAPRAELIIVKFLHLAKEPKVGPNTVGPDQRFKDAVTYIRKVADSLGMPVAINFSAGSDTGAHDGFDVRDDWLANEFKDAGSAGKVFVTSAGNSAGDQQHALIEFTGAGSVDLPFDFTDARGGALTESVTCAAKDNTMSPFIDFYYPNGGATLTFSFKPTGVGQPFTAAKALGVMPHKTGTFGGRSFSLQHSVDEDVQIAGGTIRRNRFRAIINAVPATLHVAGTYTVKIAASAAVKVHVWCFQNRKQEFKVHVPPPPPTATVTVTVSDHNLVGSPGCAKNVITVAAYDAEIATLDLAPYSSRGPVPRHGAAGGPPPAKPDIAAPGGRKSAVIARGVDAAKSANILPPVVGQTISMQGTSMASPHVAGAVALLLAKKPTLKPSEVLSILQANALKVPAPVADEVGAGRLDVKKAFDNIPP